MRRLAVASVLTGLVSTSAVPVLLALAGRLPADLHGAGWIASVVLLAAWIGGAQLALGRRLLAPHLLRLRTANAELAAALHRATSMSGAVRELTDTLCAAVDVETVAARSLERLLARTGASSGALLIARGGALEEAAGALRGDASALGRSPALVRAMKTGEPERLTPAEARLFVGEETPHALIVPLPLRGVPVGAVLLASNEPLGARAREALMAFRPPVAVALANALCRAELERIAALDPLTGAYGRRLGTKRLAEEVQRALRAGTSVGVLMVDVDHFRSINDTYGHLVGDRVLAGVARSLRGALRESDVLVRYGGEEFLVVLPGASLAESAGIAERLRAALARGRIEDGPDSIQVTASVGATAFPQLAADGAGALVAQADEALHAAKRGGRDRVALARREEHRTAA